MADRATPVARSRRSLPPTLLVVALLAMFLTGPAEAYTIYLKDGTTITTQGKYRIEGERAYFELPNGTEGFIKADEIDIERTENANQSHSGTALMLEGGEVREIPVEDVPKLNEQLTLQDLIVRGEATGSGVRRSPGAPSAPSPRPEDQDLEPDTPRTPGGFRDLAPLENRRFNDRETAEQLRDLFVQRELDEVQIHQGTQPDRPLVRVITSTEGEVFRAVVIAASALLQFQEQGSGNVGAVELLLTTPTGNRAGQFVITPDPARQLLARAIEPSAFYLRYVQF